MEYWTVRIRRDKVIIRANDYSQYEIVDIVDSEENIEPTISGILLSREGMQDIRVYSVMADGDGLLTQKVNMIYTNKFLNIDETIVIATMTGDLFSSLIIKYTSFDFMKIQMEWSNHLKNEVYCELVRPIHTAKSFLYYLFW